MSRRDRRSKSRWEGGPKALGRHGKAGNRLGTRNELRVLGILTEGDTPEWFLGVRLATHEEDAQKKDLVVETDKGEIGVQVKSGKAALIEFLRKPESEWIAGVLVKKRFPDTVILASILRELEEIRGALPCEEEA